MIEELTPVCASILASISDLAESITANQDADPVAAQRAQLIAQWRAAHLAEQAQIEHALAEVLGRITDGPVRALIELRARLTLIGIQQVLLALGHGSLPAVEPEPQAEDRGHGNDEGDIAAGLDDPMGEKPDAEHGEREENGERKAGVPIYQCCDGSKHHARGLRIVPSLAQPNGGQ